MVTFATIARPASKPNVLAVVNSAELTQADFDSYANVFRDPNGVLRVDRDVILESLINQELVRLEASRRGLSVPDARVQDLVHAWQDADLPASSLDREGGLAGLEKRFRDFLTFKAVKAAVVQVMITNDAVMAAVTADPILASQPFGEVSEIVRDRLELDAVEVAWVNWLADQRACSTIVVVDASFGVAPSSPAPNCAP